MKPTTLVRLVKDCPQIEDLRILVGMNGRLLHCVLIPTSDPFYLHVRAYRMKSAVWVDLLLPHRCVDWIAYSAEGSNLGFAHGAFLNQ